MKNTHFFLGGLLVLSLVSFASCSNDQAKLQKDIKDSVQNLSKMTSYQYEGNVTAALKSDEEPKDINFNFNFSGNLDFKDAQDPKLNLATDVVVKADAQDASGAFEARMNKDAAFFNISKFAIKDDQGTTVPKEFTDKYIGKWSRISFPEGFLKELSAQLPMGTDANLTPEQKQVRQLISDTDFLKDIRLVGTEDVKGISSDHYHGVLDKDHLYDFMLKLADLQKRSLTDDEKKIMKDDLQKYDVSGDFWVGKDNAVLDKVVLVVTLKGATTGQSGTVTIGGTLSDFNKPVTVEVPKDAQELPLGESLPLPGLSMGVESDAGLPPSILEDMSQEVEGSSEGVLAVPEGSSEVKE